MAQTVMTLSDIIRFRLINQQIAQTKFEKPQELVAWMGAMQSQDYAMAKWGIGLRIPGWKDADVENVFNKGEMLRTHVLRPTWHFVMPGDIRWMINLTAPRIIQSLAHNYRSFGWDKQFFKKANDLFAKTLQGGNQFVRDELRQVFQRAKIATDGLRFVHLLMHAELEGIICSGPRKDKQFTYVLLDERVPKSKIVKREEALAELTTRYFTSRGPATLQDFGWWSGLSLADAKKGIEMTKRVFEKETFEGKEYYFKPPALSKNDLSRTTLLLPNYDEYVISYKDRTAVLNEKDRDKIHGERNTIFGNTILVEGKIEGTWRRSLKKNVMEVVIRPFNKLTTVKQRSVSRALKSYSEFVGKSFSVLKD